jgi:hypothetical protein
MKNHSERGIALVLALLLTSAMSIVGMSLMFLSQTETYATMNYRMMSQTRYAGEAAIHRAGAFLLDSTQYAPPSTGSVTDPIGAYNRTVSPVTYGGNPVVLSASPSKASNYPVAAVVTAFQAASQGSLAAGNATLTYTAYATLMSMEEFEGYGGGARVVQRWQITGIGGISGASDATVEVIAMIETPKVSANAYAAFATANTCAAMYFHGNVTINSYDSSLGTPATTTTSTGGNVGTNGNLTIQGSVAVQGNLSTPRTGVGSCTEGAVTALTETGSATVTGSIVQLPTAVVYPPPVFSVTPPTTAVTINATSMASPATLCGNLGLVYAAPVTNADGTVSPNPSVSGSSCTVSGTLLIVEGSGADVTMPSVSVGSGYTLRFVGSTPGQNVNINSLNGAGSIEVQANMGATHANEAVVLKVAGKNADGTEMATPFDLEAMGWKQNAAVNAAAKYDASALQIVYGGTGTINMDGGNSQSAAVIYAPNANFVLKGTQDLYGSILAKTVTNGGNASIHYDRRLSRDFFVAGNPMASTFSWKRY